MIDVLDDERRDRARERLGRRARPLEDLPGEVRRLLSGACEVALVQYKADVEETKTEPRTRAEFERMAAAMTVFIRLLE